MQAHAATRLVIAASRRTWTWPALSGLLLGLAFPTDAHAPVAFLFASAWAWVALLPLLSVLHVLATAGAGLGVAFRRGWLSGGVFTLVTMYWVAGTQGGGPAVVGGTLLMAAYLGLFTGAFAAALTLVCRVLGPAGALAAPALWTAMEYVLSLGELGFPWLLLGHSQAASVGLIQYAEYTGAYGVSFCIVLVNALLHLALAAPWPGRRRLALAAAAGVAVLLPWLWGRAVLARAEAPARAATVGLVQNNLGLEKWRPGGLQRAFASLEALSRRAAADGAGLLVWPETAVPCRLARDPYCRDRVRDLAEELDAAVFAGAPDRDPRTGEPCNAAFLTRPGSDSLQSYAKMHLVPFGERTPFRDRIPLLRRIDWSALTGDLGPAEFAPGRSRTLFRYRGGRFAALICFESVFPDLVRRSVTGPQGPGGADAGPGADFLVIITNDSWFGATAGPYQHASIAALRAVENRVPIARCATSGISLFIDAFGRTSGHTSLYEEAVRVADLTPRRALTLYTRWGDVFAGANLAASLLVCAWCAARARVAAADHA